MIFTPTVGSAKVLNDLNIRQGQPTRLSGIVRKVTTGEILAFIGSVSDGENVEGNSKWFKTADNNFFWSGLVQVLPMSVSNIIQSTIVEQALFSGRFLMLPLKVNDASGKPATPFTAKISAVMDHAGTSIDPACSVSFSWGLRAKNQTVKAFNGEVGDGESTTSKPFGYTKKVPAPFFQDGEINYVGVYDSKDKYKQTYYLNYDGHVGYDYAYPVGTPLVAPADGVLMKVSIDPINGINGKATAWDGWHTFYIKHANGFSTWFLHCQKLDDQIEAVLTDCSKSISVKQGQIVAYLGSYGPVAPHLHFEVRDAKNNAIDPYGSKLWI